MKIIAKTNSAFYGGLVKILSFLSQNKESVDCLSIRNGKITDTTDTGFIYADLSQLFGENNIDFLDPKYSVKLMKLLRGGDEFVFIDDEEKNRYVITNVISSVSIAKAATGSNSSSVPEIKEELSSIDIDPDIVNSITEAQKVLEAEKIVLELDPDTNKLVCVNIDDNYTYKFDKDWDDSKEVKKFYMFNFMPIKGNGYTYKILKNGDEYWVKCVIDLTLVEVEYYEKLLQAGNFGTGLDSFSLI